MQRTWILLVLFVVLSPLLSFGDINEDLINAAENGQIEKVRALLKEGAAVNAKMKYGATALMRAAGGGHTQVVRNKGRFVTIIVHAQ